MRMVRWMCGMKLQDRDPSKELRERLELDDISSVSTAKQHKKQAVMVWACVVKRRQ